MPAGLGYDPERERHLLALRFALLNLTGFALLAVAWLQGWLDGMIAGDRTGLSLGIFCVFLVGLAVCGVKVARVNRELNLVGARCDTGVSWTAEYLRETAGRSAGSRAITGSALRIKVLSRIAVVRQFAQSLVLLGLIGTVLGFILALSGVTPEAARDVGAVSVMVASLMSGMSVALYTTLVGAVLNLWLTANYQLLAGAAARLITALVAVGEANERA